MFEECCFQQERCVEHAQQERYSDEKDIGKAGHFWDQSDQVVDFATTQHNFVVKEELNW